MPVVMLPVNIYKSNDFLLRRLRSKVADAACETGVGWGYFVDLYDLLVCHDCHFHCHMKVGVTEQAQATTLHK